MYHAYNSYFLNNTHLFLSVSRKSVQARKHVLHLFLFHLKPFLPWWVFCKLHSVCSESHVGLLVGCPLLTSLNQNCSVSTVVVKLSNMKYHESPLSSWVVILGTLRQAWHTFAHFQCGCARNQCENGSGKITSFGNNSHQMLKLFSIQKPSPVSDVHGWTETNGHLSFSDDVIESPFKP